MTKLASIRMEPLAPGDDRLCLVRIKRKQRCLDFATHKVVLDFDDGRHYELLGCEGHAKGIYETERLFNDE